MRGTYHPLQPNAQGWLWSQQLQLFLGVHDCKRRFFTAEEQLVPTLEKSALVEQQQRTEAEQRALTAEALLAQYRAQFGELPEA